MALQLLPGTNAKFDIFHPRASTSSFNVDGLNSTTPTNAAGGSSSGMGTLEAINGTIEASNGANNHKPKANYRRRSIVSFFLPPPSSISTGSPPVGELSSRSISNCTGLSYTLPLPQDIFLTIASFVSSSVLLNLMLASSALYDILLPSLYRTLVLPSSHHCLTVLYHLTHHNGHPNGRIRTGRSLCSYIRELVLKPNYYLAWPKKDKHIDENWVSRMVQTMAKRGWLANLEVFEWEGLEVPQDDMWEALRVGCPRLRSILTIVGAKSIDSQSKIFDFSNLTSFSIIVRHHVDGFDTDTTYPSTSTPLPSKFWDMINNRCSQTLSELHICSFSPGHVAFDFGPLFHSISSTSTDAGVTETRFPKLTSLTLGVFGYQPDYTIPSSPCMLLGEFVAKHPSITYLRVLWNFKRWLSPDDLSFFFHPLSPISLALPQRQHTQTILPQLDTFIGVYQQLASIPIESRKHIHTVDLTCEPLYDLRAHKAWEVLKTVQGLKVLDVWVHLPSHSSGVSDGGTGERTERFFEKLVDACMSLEEMHFMCTTPFCMNLLDQFLHYLSQLPSLRRFSLTKGHVYRHMSSGYKLDDSMFNTAVRVFRACKGVKTVSVRYAREKCLNHLKKEGMYEIEKDPNVVDVVLAGHEKGISLLGRPYEKRYRRRVVL